MNWKYLSRRRNIALEVFLAGISTEVAALQYFADKNISDPPVEEIKKMFKKNTVSAKQEVPADVSETAKDLVNVVRKVTPKKTKYVKEEDQ